ncbi:hypothetical protein PMAC_001535 [Pneumocystis sp. 'macacae']|nr:hypothetical protein PMAC_001535 [Pneumocystis sp. 'macacae']
MNIFKDHIRGLQNFQKDRFINLHSFKEFLDFRRLTWPRDIIDVQQRMRCNLSRFSSNYSICFGLIVLYFLLTNPLLLFVLLFTTGGFFGISRLNGQNLHIGSFHLTPSQLYTGTYFFNLMLKLLLYIASEWSTTDYEIFDIVSALESTEGKGTTFYSFLNLEKGPNSRLDEINKAYRQKALELHPDKIKDKKLHKISQERFSRLGLIANILRNDETKKRYDFFYKNGFPKWKGSGYYYSRYRPSFGFVLLILLIISSCLQYISFRLNATRNRNRIKHYILSAIYAARGPNTASQRNSGRKKIIDQETGRSFIVEPDNSVYFVDTDGSKCHLDINNVPPAQFKNIFVFVFLKFLWKHSFKKLYQILLQKPEHKSKLNNKI